MCGCEKAKILEKEIAIKDKLIEVLKEALNEPCYCEDHVIFRKCSKKDIMCGDCLVKEFYDNLDKE